MGKKLIGAALRAKKRSREVIESIQEQQAENASSQWITGKTNEELFLLDRQAEHVPMSQQQQQKLYSSSSRTSSTNKKKKARRSNDDTDDNEEEGKVDYYNKSKDMVDQEQVTKLIQRYNGDVTKLQQLANQGKKLLESRTLYRRSTLRGKQTKDRFDLWDNDGNNADTNTNTTITHIATTTTATAKTTAKQLNLLGTDNNSNNKNNNNVMMMIKKKKEMPVAVDVAKPGQSYHPDQQSYQSVVQMAMEVEMRRSKAEQYQNTPLSQGLSAETRALLIGDTDSEEEEEEDQYDDDNNDNNDNHEGLSNSNHVLSTTGTTMGPIPKRIEKKTRAQRNKEKRLRQQQAIIDKQRMEKQLLKQIGEVPKYKKEIKRKENETIQQANMNTSSPSPTTTVVLGVDVEKKLSELNPIQAPAYPVALPSELQSSLRLVKPKGNLALDRMASYIDRSLIPKCTFMKQIQNKNKKRRKSVKGKHNQGVITKDCIILG